VALDGENMRNFIIPANSEFIQSYYEGNGKQFAINITIGSTYRKKNRWQHLAQFEDGYYHIEEARQRYSKQLEKERLAPERRNCLCNTTI
jgi:hypothetical protein